MKFKSIVAGLTGALMLSSAAMAADIVYVPPPAAPPPPPPAPVKFDWSGFYAGISDSMLIGIGGQVGYNFVPSNILFGIEANGHFFFGPNVFLGQVKGRLGFVLGAEGRGLLYGTAGVVFGPGIAASAGGGIAIGFRNRPISWFLEGDVVFGGGVLVTTGINFHFN